MLVTEYDRFKIEKSYLSISLGQKEVVLMEVARNIQWIDPAGDHALSPDGSRVLGVAKFYLPLESVARLKNTDLTRADSDEIGNRILIDEHRSPIGTVSDFFFEVLVKWYARRSAGFQPADDFLKINQLLFIHRPESRPLRLSELYDVPILDPRDL